MQKMSAPVAEEEKEEEGESGAPTNIDLTFIGK